MDAEELAGRLGEVQVVDVRYPDEWDAGRIAGAVHLPADDLAERVGELDPDRPVVTVCRSGERSQRAAAWLRDEGFEAQSLDGGLLAWAEAGLEIRAADGEAGTVADPEPPADQRPDRMQELQASFLEVIFAAHERFGDREPSEEEMRAFLRERLLAEGKTPGEADAFLARMDEG